MKNGFTLLEVLLALAMICFVMTGVARLVTLTMKTDAYADRQTRAAIIVSQKIAELENLAFNDAELAAAWHADDDNPMAARGCSYGCYWQVDESAEVKTVDLYVVWSANAHQVANLTGPEQLGGGLNNVHLCCTMCAD